MLRPRCVEHEPAGRFPIDLPVGACLCATQRSRPPSCAARTLFGPVVTSSHRCASFCSRVKTSPSLTPAFSLRMSCWNSGPVNIAPIKRHRSRHQRQPVGLPRAKRLFHRWRPRYLFSAEHHRRVPVVEPCGCADQQRPRFGQQVIVRPAEVPLAHRIRPAGETGWRRGLRSAYYFRRAARVALSRGCTADPSLRPDDPSSRGDRRKTGCRTFALPRRRSTVCR